MWMLLAIVLQIEPASAAPVTLQQTFTSEAECGNSKNALETQYRKNPSGYHVMITCGRIAGDDEAVVSWRWRNDANKSAALEASP